VSDRSCFFANPNAALCALDARARARRIRTQHRLTLARESNSIRDMLASFLVEIAEISAQRVKVEFCFVHVTLS
jgi:hypothetical protein